MEKRNYKMIISNPGGNSSKNSKKYRLSIPSSWAKDMGVTSEDREVQISYIDKKIIIEKVVTEKSVKKIEERRLSVERALAISLSAAIYPTDSFMTDLEKYILGEITFNELENNVDKMKYLGDD